MLDTFWQIFKLAVGGATLGAPFAYFFFKFLAEKWITTRFDNDMARYKHSLSIEMERFKLDLNTDNNRMQKMQEKEFELLTQIWKLNERAYNKSVILVGSKSLRAYPNISKMPPTSARLFLEKTPLTAHSIDFILSLNKDDQAGAVKTFIDTDTMLAAQNAHAEFANFLSDHGIFFPPPIRNAFDDCAKAILELIGAWHSSTVRGHLVEDEPGTQLLIAAAIEKKRCVTQLVQNRFWSEMDDKFIRLK